jgi:tripeptide aminopeptidase
MINKKRLTQTLLDLIKIDSPSGSEANIVKEVTKRLTALGYSVETDSYGNIIAKISGEGEPIMLNAHLDTVEPGRGINPIISGDTITSDGTTILGGDPKAGIAIILEALTSLKETRAKHLPLEIVFTLDEELGLLGAINLDYSKIIAKRGVTFDGLKEVNNIHISAPGYHRVDATIIGRSSHAGIAPEQGISAIQITSEIISQLKLGRIDEETTANIGLIEGGSARNAIPEKTHIKGEIRSRSKNKLEKHAKHFQEVFNKVLAKYPEAKLELVVKGEFDPYIFSSEHPGIRLITNIFKQMNLSPKLQKSGGGTDVNIFHSHGIEAIAVGMGDYEAHTTREYVVISQMVEAAKFCEKLIRK